MPLSLKSLEEIHGEDAVPAQYNAADHMATRGPLHQEIIQNTFHPKERELIRTIDPVLRVELVSTMPPDAASALLAKSAHEASARLLPPSITDRLKRLLSPAHRQYAEEAAAEARHHIAVTEEVIMTHDERMTAPKHNEDFAGRLRPDHSIKMQIMAQALHANHDDWQKNIDPLIAQLKEILSQDQQSAGYHKGARLQSSLSELHVTAHRAADQLQLIGSHEQAKLADANVTAIKFAAARLRTLCLRLEQWSMVDYATIQKNFHYDKNLRDFRGEWH